MPRNYVAKGLRAPKGSVVMTLEVGLDAGLAHSLVLASSREGVSMVEVCRRALRAHLALSGKR